jgi:hypothetical protein
MAECSLSTTTNRITRPDHTVSTKSRSHQLSFVSRNDVMSAMTKTCDVLRAYSTHGDPIPPEVSNHIPSRTRANYALRLMPSWTVPWSLSTEKLLFAHQSRPGTSVSVRDLPFKSIFPEANHLL